MDSSEKNTCANIVFIHPPLQQFTYKIPELFARELCLGHRVLVPLGKRRMAGFVVDFPDEPAKWELKEIEDILDPYPLLTPDLLDLLRWVAEYYMAPLGAVIRSALPPAIHRKSRVIVRSTGQDAIAPHPLSELEDRILSLVRQKIEISQQSLEKQLASKRIRFPLAKLEKKGLIELNHVLQEEKARAQSETWISLKNGIDPENIRTFSNRAPKQTELLMTLKESNGRAKRSDLKADLRILKSMEQKGWIDIQEKEKFRDMYDHVTRTSPEPMDLTEEQRRALSQINAEIEKTKFHVFLLHGVTGSGKTQVYIEAIRHAIQAGKTALVLIPEISLTPQAVERYRGHFGNRVAVMHSRMSLGERYDAWRGIREGKYQIALGPRSAVFAPLENLGLIVVDEEHDASYKQADPSPRYNARDVAVVRAKMNGCVVILGSATPSLESYANSIDGKYTRCTLSQRIDDVPLPQVTLVDHNDTSKEKEHKIISPLLRERMKARLENGEQIILLQNRRGYASFLRCQACGFIQGCPHCDISLTYHQKGHQLQCHYCGFQKKASDVCPQCGGATLHYRGVGTQRVEEEVRRLFPQARVFRMDRDTTKRKGTHDRFITRFEKREADVLLGTQMVAKGHDFPGVRLVGIISADTGLHFPDFRSGEKTFQLLTQAAGRAGRRSQRGEVVVQTFSPDNPVLEFSRRQDYDAFYRWASEQRKELNYPPWGRIVLLRFKGTDEARTANAARAFAAAVTPNRTFSLLGPVPCPISRVKNQYRHQIILRLDKNKDPSGKNLRNTIRKALSIYHERTRFHDVRIGIDVDPVDML